MKSYLMREILSPSKLDRYLWVVPKLIMLELSIKSKSNFYCWSNINLQGIESMEVMEQQKMGENGGIVMDGRDIGSVVFPFAELKLFITASKEIRAQRRFLELKSKGIESKINEISSNLAERDLMDSSRKESPLIQVADAIVLDNSKLTREKQLDFVLDLVRNLV